MSKLQHAHCCTSCSCSCVCVTKCARLSVAVLCVWPPSAGTKWIDAPNIAPICRSLGIDYAPALVGFEVQGGRMVPRIRGVVVCEVSEHHSDAPVRAASPVQRCQAIAAKLYVV